VVVDVKLDANPFAKVDSILKSNHTQAFNSVDKITGEDIYITVSDEGLLYVLNQKSSHEHVKETCMELLELEDDDTEMVSPTTEKNKKKNTKNFNPY
jgi:hypothetical protein